MAIRTTRISDPKGLSGSLEWYTASSGNLIRRWKLLSCDRNLSSLCSIYLNTETEAFVTVPDPDNDYADLDPEAIPDVSRKEFIRLPDQYDVHEKSIMEYFAAGIADAGMRNRLFYALAFPPVQEIQGRGRWVRYR